MTKLQELLNLIAVKIPVKPLKRKSALSKFKMEYELLESEM